jgi:branched-chain amino acid transport system ATP-binding protein
VIPDTATSDAVTSDAVTSDAATVGVPILSLSCVNTYYGDSHILHDLSFDLQRGEVAALMGRNGVGKTTTIQTILGLPAPRRGTISFQGRPITGRPTFAIVRSGIAWVPQGHRIFPTLSADENLALAAARGAPGRWDVSEIHRLFPRLAARRSARGDALSGGEQQMLAIARALVQNPRLIMMDEPSEGLSPLLVREIEDVILRLRGAGISVLLVEQNLNLALAVADRVFIMNKGAIVLSGSPAEIGQRDDAIGRYLGVGARNRD